MSDLTEELIDLSAPDELPVPVPGPGMQEPFGPPAPPMELPPKVINYDMVAAKQYCKVEEATGDVVGFFLQVEPPEAVAGFYFAEIEPAFSAASNPRTTPTQVLRHRGGKAVVWEDDAPVEVLRARAIDTIDAAGEELRMAVITRLTQTPEYERAERHAREYQAAGYPEGEDAYVPPGVASWAQAKWRDGWTARQAADDILATADRWYGILDDIRALRLTNKEDVRAAGTAAEITAICSDMNADMGAITQRLRLTITS